MLTDDELDSMRGTVVDALPVTGIIRRRTATADGLGGATATYTAIASHVPMRLAPLDGAAFAEGELAGRATNEKRWMLTLAADVDVRTTDRLELDGRVFEVDSIAARRSWELSTRVVVDEVQ